MSNISPAAVLRHARGGQIVQGQLGVQHEAPKVALALRRQSWRCVELNRLTKILRRLILARWSLVRPLVARPLLELWLRSPLWALIARTLLIWRLELRLVDKALPLLALRALIGRTLVILRLELRLADKAAPLLALWREVLLRSLHWRTAFAALAARLKPVLLRHRWAAGFLPCSGLAILRALLPVLLPLTTWASFFAASAFLARLALRLELFGRNAAVGIAVEFAESLDRFVDLGRIDCAVVVGVEHPKEVSHRALATLLALRWGWALLGFWRVLRVECDAGEHECDCGDDSFVCVHGICVSEIPAGL